MNLLQTATESFNDQAAYNDDNSYDQDVIKEVLIQETADAWIRQTLVPEKTQSIQDGLTETYTSNNVEALEAEIQSEIYLESVKVFNSKILDKLKIDTFKIEDEYDADNGMLESFFVLEAAGDSVEKPANLGEKAKAAAKKVIEQAKKLYRALIAMIKNTISKIKRFAVSSTKLKSILTDADKEVDHVLKAIQDIEREAMKLGVTPGSAKMALLIQKTLQSISGDLTSARINVSQMSARLDAINKSGADKKITAKKLKAFNNLIKGGQKPVIRGAVIAFKLQGVMDKIGGAAKSIAKYAAIIGGAYLALGLLYVGALETGVLDIQHAASESKALIAFNLDDITHLSNKDGVLQHLDKNASWTAKSVRFGQEAINVVAWPLQQLMHGDFRYDQDDLIRYGKDNINQDVHFDIDKDAPYIDQIKTYSADMKTVLGRYYDSLTKMAKMVGNM